MVNLKSMKTICNKVTSNINTNMFSGCIENDIVTNTSKKKKNYTRSVGHRSYQSKEKKTKHNCNYYYYYYRY